MKDKPILITGCARSGTSLTAGIISRCGAWGGEVVGSTPNNQKGQYENTAIRNKVIKPYLKSIAVDPMGQNPLPPIDRVTWDANGSMEICNRHKKEVMDILYRQGYDGKSVWFFKGAKLCLIYPIWVRMFPEAKWVLVRRDDYDICSSCLKTSFMRAFNKRNGWMVWINEHKKRFAEMKMLSIDLIEYWPFKAINGDFTGTEEMIKHLDLEYHKEEIEDFVSPKLWHYKEEGGVK